MTKEELVAAVFESCGEDIKSKAGAGRIVGAVFETLGHALVNDGEIRIPGFGTFRVKERKARAARNPQTGDTIQIPAKNAVTFKPASDLKDSVNSGSKKRK